MGAAPRASVTLVPIADERGNTTLRITLCGEIRVGPAKVTVWESDAGEGGQDDLLGTLSGEVRIEGGEPVFVPPGPAAFAPAPLIGPKNIVRYWEATAPGAEAGLEERPVYVFLAAGSRGAERRFGMPVVRDADEAVLSERGRLEIFCELEAGGAKLRSTIYELGFPVWEVTPAVDRTKFPYTDGNRVKLYHDAHGSLDGSGCFEDMARAIEGAKRLIYITDWSMWVHTHLRRSPDGNHPGPTIGELLKRKAAEGVEVCVHIWDDTAGAVDTRDGETISFFKKSKVRAASSSPGTAGGARWATCSHHQKTIICDAPDDGGKRKLVAFVGGLDICDGRWDTPDHAIFKTRNGVHKGDWYNAEASAVKGDLARWPRQPWHDIHSFVDGPAAMHVYENFVGRWKTQVDKGAKLVDPVEFRHCWWKPRGDWRVQVLRSITKHEDRTAAGSERGIQLAYLKAIANAERFVYIETQYFMGSARFWPDSKDASVENLLGYWLATKIHDKIMAGEPFRAYVVLPLFPEGDPGSGSNREQRFWQWNTFRLMYAIIAEATAKKGGHPTDYLRFYFLGRTEPEHAPDTHGLDFEDDAEARAMALQSTRRYMIYVHSKLMIVDDALAIVGSANLNERSLAGDRDTEICIAASQRGSTVERRFAGRPVRISPEVHAFRKRLFREHLGGSDADWADPLDPATWRRVETRAYENYAAFLRAGALPHGHLMPHPQRVGENGMLAGGHELLPDFARDDDEKHGVMGRRALGLPKLTG